MAKDGQIVKALMLVLVMFISVEVALQIRSQLKFGTSIFSTLFASKSEDTKLYEQRNGFKILTPNASFVGNSISIASNSLGLRSPEIDNISSGLRVIVLGASSAYGAYAKSNDYTFPALMHSNNRYVELDVINAGIPGNDIGSQFKLYDQLLGDVKANVVILYSGLSNDIGRLCRKGSASASFVLPQLTAPKWLLTVDLLLKNTTELRYVPYKYSPMPELTPYLEQYQADVQNIIKLAHARGVSHIILAENLSSFRPEQPLQLQNKLAESALYYTPCLSVLQFSEVFKQYNQVLENVSKQYDDVHYLTLSDKVPGGRQYFTDSVHFSFAGEQLMADALLDAIDGLEAISQ